MTLYVLWEHIFQLAVIGLLLHMPLTDPLGIHTADSAVKSLGFLGRMGGNVELLCAFLCRPCGNALKYSASKAHAAVALISMQLQEIRILFLISNEAGGNCAKRHKMALMPGSKYCAALQKAAAQVFHQQAAIARAPIVDKGCGNNGPFPILPPSCILHNLRAHKGMKKVKREILRGERPNLKCCFLHDKLLFDEP